MGDHLRDGESDGFIVGLIDAAGHLRALHEGFAYDLVALLESAFDSGIDILHRFHFGATEGGTADIGFDETGQS